MNSKNFRIFNKINKKMKNRGITIILAFILGSLGIHRFYLGQIGYGLIYLLLSFTGISTILSIIDFVLFLIMSEQEFNRKYN